MWRWKKCGGASSSTKCLLLTSRSRATSDSSPDGTFSGAPPVSANRMLTFLFLCAVGMAFAGLLAIPFMLFGLIFWVITLPFRLFFGLFGLFFALIFGIFRVVFGIIGGILGFILAPVGLLVLALFVIGGVIVGLLSLLAPLVPSRCWGCWSGRSTGSPSGVLHRHSDNLGGMPRVRLVLALILCSWLLRPASMPQQPPPYRILISNDDGVRAPGIAAVAQILQAIGQVIIVAPAENQSGKGHSIVTSEPVFREDLTLPNGLKAIGADRDAGHHRQRRHPQHRDAECPTSSCRGSIAATTSDTRRICRARSARRAKARCTACRRSRRRCPGGRRAPELRHAAEEVLGVARRVKQYGLPRNTFLNVNVPAMPPDGYRGLHASRRRPCSESGEERFAETPASLGPYDLLERVQRGWRPRPRARTSGRSTKATCR